MHATNVASVFNLDTPIHDHRDPAFFSDVGAFLVNNIELTPKYLCADLNRILRDAR